MTSMHANPTELEEQRVPDARSLPPRRELRQEQEQSLLPDADMQACERTSVSPMPDFHGNLKSARLRGIVHMNRSGDMLDLSIFSSDQVSSRLRRSKKSKSRFCYSARV